MIIPNNLKSKQIRIIAGIAIIFLLLFGMVFFYRSNFPYWVSAVEIICGAILALSIGLCFYEETRMTGIIFSICSVLTPIFSIVGGLLTGNPADSGLIISVCILGFFIGIIYTFMKLRKGAGSLSIGKVLSGLLILMISAVSLFIIVFGVLFPAFSRLSYYGIPTDASELQSYINLLSPIIAILIVFIVLKYFILKCNLGISSTDIFVVGPRGSGKTYFAVGLWSYFNSKCDVSEKVTPSLNFRNLGARDDAFNDSLFGLHEELIEKRTLPHTPDDRIKTYRFQLKKMGIIPVSWNILDYPGERFSSISNDDYIQSLKNIASFQNGSFGTSEEHASRDEMLRIAKLSNEDLIPAIKVSIDAYQRAGNSIDERFVRSVITYIVNSGLMHAGKIIFLIDGTQLKKEWLSRHNEDRIYGQSEYADADDRITINEAFYHYNKILQNLEISGKGKIQKRVAFIVTKTDDLCQSSRTLQDILKKNLPSGAIGKRNDRVVPLSVIHDYPENTAAAVTEIEQFIYKMFDEFAGYHTCIRTLTAHDIPVYLIASSIDDMTKADGSPGENGRLNLFGFSEIESFGK